MISTRSTKGVENVEAQHGIKLSSSQIRGHPRKGEFSLRQAIFRKTASPEQKYVELVRLMNREEKSFTAALNETGLSRRHFETQNHKYGHIARAEDARPGQRSYTISRLSPFDVITKSGRYLEAVPFAGENASIMGRYWSAVAKAERNGSSAPLETFKSTRLFDADGNRIELATDLKVIKSAKKKLSRDQFERSSVMTASG